jgi:hypothetical protein
MPNWSITKDTPARLIDLEIIYGRIVTVVIGLAGLVFFLMLIVGGFKFITAGGEAPKVESARKTLTVAVAGLVLIALALLIMRLLEALTGLDLTTFRVFIPG